MESLRNPENQMKLVAELEAERLSENEALSS
jgi:hypothetical protein